MNEYRDMVVVFGALALVAVLVLLSALMPGPTGELAGGVAEAKPKSAGVRLRFGEPVIDVKEDKGALSTDKKETKVKSGQADRERAIDNSILSFTEYVFPIDTNGMRKAIESISPALVECYQQWQSLDDNVGVGVWDAVFFFGQSSQIEGTSRVRDIRLKHPSPDVEVMEQCLLEMFGMLRFEVQGPRRFKHPMVFDIKAAGSSTAEQDS